ncbi:hypothetical protein ATX39_09615 [Oenococcus oeni]|nr:hypothetical protein ATX39_09615 [Oenococcus oeni]
MIKKFRGGEITYEAESKPIDWIILALLLGALMTGCLYAPVETWGRIPYAECGNYHRVVTPGTVFHGWQIQQFNGYGWDRVKTYETKDEALTQCARLHQ